MGKPTWENINERLGKKIYDITDKSQLDSCARELAVRRYLDIQNFVNVTALKMVEPKEIANYVNETYKNAEYIRNKFENVKAEIEEVLEGSKIKTIELYIERGQDIVDYQIHKISNSVDKNDALKMVREIFSLVHAMHANFIVHSDLKPHNLMYCTRNGNDTLVLNDFDVSFVLPTRYPSRSLDVFGMSVKFAAPEQFGIPKNDSTIGYATDVFSAALISYIVLNQGLHPAEYHPDSFDTTNCDELEKNIRRMFKEMAKGSLSWTPPRYGSNKIKEVILNAMNVDKTKRYTAKQVIDAIDAELNAASADKPVIPPAPEPTPALRNNIETNTNANQTGNIDNSGDGSVTITNIYNPVSPAPEPPTQPEQQEPKKGINNTAVFIIVAALLIVGAFIIFGNSGSAGNNKGAAIPDIGAVTVTSDESTTTLPLTTTTAVPMTIVCTTETKAIETTMPAAKGGNSNNQVGDGNINVQGDNNNFNLTNNDNHTENYENNNNTENNYYEAVNNEPEPPIESPTEPPLYYYEDSPYNDGIILTGFGCDFTDAVLEIPEEFDGRIVTGIGEGAFKNNEYIEEIYIPDTVYSIYSKAFYNLYNLKNVYLGRSVNSIYKQAFLLEKCTDPRTFFFSRYDWKAVLRGEDCLGAEGEYNIEYQNCE